MHMAAEPATEPAAEPATKPAAETAAGIVTRLDVAAVRMRAPLWVCVLLPWVLQLAPYGVALCGAWIWWDYRRIHARVRRQWTGWLDGALPGLEDSSALLEQATGERSAIARMQRQRILRRIDSDLRPDVVDSIVAERVRFDWRIAAASAAGALVLFAWERVSGMPVTARTVLARLAPASSELVLRVTPPRYTGAARFETTPRDLEVPQSSLVEWCLRNRQESVGKRAEKRADKVELGDGSVLPVGRQCARWRAAAPMLWRWRGQRYHVTVRADRPPRISIGAPGELVQVLPEAAQSVHIAVRVRDDHRVRRATLHLLLVRGAGQEAQISERELALPLSLSTSRDGRTRNWSRHWSMAELGMQPGDELYVHVRAQDDAEPAQASISPTYTLRLPAPHLAEDAPRQDSLRLQGAIHAGIDALRAQGALEPFDEETLQARIDTLAAGQAALRTRYEMYLGEEGRGARFDPLARPVLRRALAAMSDTEQALGERDLQAAHAWAGRALAAVGEVRHAERLYLYRSALAPAEADDAVAESGAGSRAAQHGAGQAMPAPVLRLTAALSGSGPLPAGWQRTAYGWLARPGSGDTLADQRSNGETPAAQRSSGDTLAAQRVVQDVADGCQPCRATLRAWLRAGAAHPAPAVRTDAVIDTPFARAWQGAPAGHPP